MDPLTWVLITAVFCVLTVMLNLWTLNRAEKVEERIKRMLFEDGMLCPLCGDHYRRTECSPTSRL